MTEGGNAATQAAIGETVTYTVTTTIPAGTTLYATPKVTDALGARQTYVAGSLTATLNGVNLPTAGVSAAVAANVVTATFPATYANPTGTDTLVLTFMAKVLDGATNIRGTDLPNTATLTFQDQLGRPGGGSSAVDTRIVEPKVALTKTHAPAGRVTAGQIVTFTINATNPTATNVSTAHDVVVVDTLPIGTDPVTATGTPVADGGSVPTSGGVWSAAARTITWTKTTNPFLATMAPGAAPSLVYFVKLESSPVAGFTYTNTADETVKSLDGTIAGVRTSTSPASTAPGYAARATDVLATALPAVTKVVTPDPVTIGNRVTWHVQVTLPKSERYFDTTVVDTVPDGFDVDGYGSQTCVSGCLPGDPAVASFAVTSVAPGKLQAAWYIGDLAASANDRVYDFVLTGHLRSTYRSGGASVLAGQTLTNSIVVHTNRTNVVAGTPATVPATFNDTVGPATAISRVVEPALTLTKTASKGPIVEGGDPLVYTVVVKNTGTAPAYDIVVHDLPDNGLTNVALGAGAALNTDGWTAANPLMRWLITGPLAVGASTTLTYTADVKPGSSFSAGAQIVNTAQVVENYGVPKATRTADGFVYRVYNGPTAKVTLSLALPELEIAKTPDHGSATAGAPSSFTINVSNRDANATAHNVIVHDVLQAGLTYVPSAATASPAAGFSETGSAGQTIDWRIATIAPGASVTITVPLGVSAAVASGATLLNTASTHADEVPADKTDTGSLDVVARADLQVTKTSAADPIVPGTNFLYTMVVRNNGPSVSHASQLTDTLPSYLSFVSLDDPAHCATSGQVITCSFGTLAKGDTRTVHVTVALDPDRTAAISNTADATTTTADTDPSNDVSSVPNSVRPTADISIRKTADASTYVGGAAVTYTLVAHNGGPSTAQAVTADDDLPAGVTFVSVSPAAPTCTLVARHLHCDLGALAPGADATVTIVTRADGAPPAGSTDIHKITVDKAEQSQALQAGEAKTFDVTCGANAIASDGSVEVMHVDQGTGTPADVRVAEARSIALGTYRFTVENTTTGQAQIKLFVACLPYDTDPSDHTHPIVVGPLQILATGAVAPGRHTLTIPTSAGHRAVAPGIEVLSGRARLVGGEPNGNGWTFIVEVLEAASVNLSIRALDNSTGLGGDPGHVHAFGFEHVVRTVSLPPGVSVQRVECPTGYKGIVGAFDLPAGILPLGNEPQPINRDFRLLNTTGQNVSVTLGLVCITIDAGPPGVATTIVNTATAGTPTFDPDHANDASSASIVVTSALAI